MNGPLSPPSCLVVSSFLQYLVACFFGIYNPTSAARTQRQDHVRPSKTAGAAAGRCRHWVNRAILLVGQLLPVFSRKRTSSGPVEMSQRPNIRSRVGIDLNSSGGCVAKND